MQCQYPYADTKERETPTDRSPDDRRNHPHDPMTTPDDATATESTRTTDQQTTTASDRTTTADASLRRIPGRTPNTAQAGASLVPPTRTDETAGSSAPGATDGTATGSPADGGSQ